MDERIDAKRPVGADEPRLDPFNKVEARPPDQRAIAEHPEVFSAMFGIPLHAWRTSIGKNAVELKRLARSAERPNRSSSKGRIRQLVAGASGRLTPRPRVEWHGSLVYDRSVVPYVHSSPPPLAGFPTVRVRHRPCGALDRFLVLCLRTSRDHAGRLARARGQGRPRLLLRQAERRRISIPLRSALRRTGCRVARRPAGGPQGQGPARRRTSLRSRSCRRRDQGPAHHRRARQAGELCRQLDARPVERAWHARSTRARILRVRHADGRSRSRKAAT